MCSSHGGVETHRGSCAPTELVDQLERVLRDLVDADVTQLTANEHSRLLPQLIRAQHVLHAAVLGEVAAFDAADIATTSRHRTTKRWIEHRARVSAGTASHLTETARALRDHLPATHDALSQGQVSPQHVSAVTAVARKVGVEHATAAEPHLLAIARAYEPSVVRRATARIHELVDPAGAEKALHNVYDKRGVTLSVVGDRGYLDGVLDIESTELLMSALMPLMEPGGDRDARTTPQRRADALLDLAERSLAAADEPTLGGERPHLSVVIDEQALQRSLGPATLPWTGASLPARAVRRWACDAQLTPVVARLLRPVDDVASPSSGATTGAVAVAGTGSDTGTGVSIGGGWLPLAVGRASRTVTTAQLKALRVRDGGCVHPGCTRTAAFCHAHHVRHWADGGPTAVDNMVLLCRHHHRTLHSGDWSLVPDSRQPGVFWSDTAGWQRRTQTAADRSPPLTVRVSTASSPDPP